MSKDLQGSFKKYLKKWKTLHHEAQQITIQYKELIQKIDQNLISQATRIHETVDETLGKTRWELREISEVADKALQAQEKSINDKCEQIQRNIEQLEELAHDKEVMFDMTDIAVLPTLTRQTPPRYIPGQIDDKTIKSIMGDIYDYSSNSRNVANNTAFPSTQITLSELSTVSSFNPDGIASAIVCTPSLKMSWVNTDNKSLQLIDRQSTVKDSIKIKFRFADFTVNPQGDVLLTDENNDRIVSASKKGLSWRMTTLFSTPYSLPQGLCCLRNGDVIVTYPYDNQVIHHDQKGTIIYTFDPTLFSWPQKIAMNKANNDIYICDIHTNKLLAFGKNHKLRFEYTPFSTHDVSTDTNGHIFVTDQEYDTIHLLDQDGKFLRYLQSPGLKAPVYIDTDIENNAWILQKNGQLKIVKYEN